MNIKQMEQIGSIEDIDIVVQWASSGNKTTKRIHVEKSTNASEVTSPVIEDSRGWIWVTTNNLLIL